MSKINFEVSGNIVMEYDENSPEFKEAFEGYTSCIERNGTIRSMLKHVAFYVTRFGTDGLVEGVGYVGYNGHKPTREPYSGIMIDEDFDEYSFE